MKTLYFDCFAGASGNMILGALVALGIDENELIEQIKLLDVSDFEVEFRTMDKSGISAIHADVQIPKEHAHRHLGDIEKIINDSRLKDSVKKRAIQIFTKLAKAEATVHGTDIQKIHFHEVGAMDAIVDVVGACVGFEMLGIEKFYCSKIHTGSGFVKMAHGKFPVPPPAVAEILQSVNAPVYQTEIEGELITPTGAAIIATVCESFGAMPEIQIEKTAYGAGTREYKDFPNALRLILGSINITKDYQKELSGTQKELSDAKLRLSDTEKELSDVKTQLSDKEIQASDEEIQLSDVKIQASDAEIQSSDAEIQSSDTEIQSSDAEIQLSDGKNQYEDDEKDDFGGGKHPADGRKHDEKQILALIETNLDDVSPEILGFLMERAFALGALDCWFTPIQMKKNRPATMISILCSRENREVFTELLYTETTTLGVRISEVERQCLPRETVQFETEYGTINVKIASFKNKIVNAKPEYDQIREIALKSNKSFREIKAEIEDLIAAKLKL